MPEDKVQDNLTTVPLESIGAQARGETSSTAILFSSNLPRWDENHNLGKDES